MAQVADKPWAAVKLTFGLLPFLTLGLMLHGDIVAYASATAEGGGAIVGVVFQLPCTRLHTPSHLSRTAIGSPI
jgi:hypothetical protein